tara:strand:+ start:2678 stop:3274 length:597 start_codon:yes stop_codon:yes gene_type:complete
MKLLFLILITLIITNCSNMNGKTYWCGDHPCLNNDEKNEYFKKTMTVEIREILIKNNKKEVENRKKLIKEAKLKKEKKLKDEKKAKLEEKKIEKKIRLEEKKREQKIKIEAKQRALDEIKVQKEAKLDNIKKQSENKKNKLKEMKVKKKQNNKTKEKDFFVNKLISDDANTSIFNKLVEAINKKNSLKPYPNINDIPE